MTLSALTTLTSRVVPLPARDVDTDQIIPARFLKVTDRAALGSHLFAGWRYHPDGAPNQDFVLNRAENAGARILVAGPNFGCGSSREHAAWALLDWGFRAVIAPSFADIFHGNALKNGLLPVAVSPAAHTALLDARAKDPGLTVTVDLVAQTVTLPDGAAEPFPIDPFARHCVLNGLDELDYLLGLLPQVERHEAARTA
jgi:3-isopropylmalate/(R)-2-methylmalate dehydratase small subunit